MDQYFQSHRMVRSCCNGYQVLVTDAGSDTMSLGQQKADELRVLILNGEVDERDVAVRSEVEQRHREQRRRVLLLVLVPGIHRRHILRQYVVRQLLPTNQFIITCISTSTTTYSSSSSSYRSFHQSNSNNSTR